MLLAAAILLTVLAVPLTALAQAGNLVQPDNLDSSDAEAIQVQARYTLRTDDSGLADVDVRLRDKLTGEALDLPPRRLAAWLQRSLPTLSEGELSCPDKVRLLASPGPGRRAVVDFNVYRMLVVNDDQTITFINPFLRLNNAKLEDIVTLPGKVSAIQHRPDAHEVWLTSAEADSVIVIDTDSRKIKHTHALPTGARPVALALVGGVIWVALDGRDEWLRFADATSEPRIVFAPRAHSWLVLSDQAVPVGIGPAGVVSIDGGTPIAHDPDDQIEQAAWSPLAHRIVLALRRGGLAWMDPRDGRISQRMALPPVRLMAAFDNGRYLLAVGRDRVHVVDLATAAVQQSLALEAPVTEIGFSASFAYLHSADAARATLLSITDLRKGAAAGPWRPIQVSLGATSGAAINTASGAADPGSAHANDPRVSGARLMQEYPGGTGMMVANPLDGQLYQYAEGMMAPAGSFSNYRRSATALLVLDDALRARGSGEYRAVIHAPKTGAYELVLSGIQPRFASCQAMALQGPAIEPLTDKATSGLRATLLGVERDSVGTRLRVMARVRESQGAGSSADLADLTLLAFDRRSGWQMRRRMTRTVEGDYEASLDAPAAATLDLRVGSREGDLPFLAGGLGTYQMQRAATDEHSGKAQ